MFKLELKEDTFLDLYEQYKLRFGGFYKDRIQLEKSTRKSALQVDIERMNNRIKKIFNEWIYKLRKINWERL
jgi:hypothetical protein